MFLLQVHEVYRALSSTFQIKIKKAKKRRLNFRVMDLYYAIKF
jgi:hypothetical protein